MNIDHIVLWVDNQQHSLAFFVDLLGRSLSGLTSSQKGRPASPAFG